MHIKAKKSLGQNFLIDRNILEEIINVVDFTNKESLTEGHTKLTPDQPNTYDSERT